MVYTWWKISVINRPSSTPKSQAFTINYLFTSFLTLMGSWTGKIIHRRIARTRDPSCVTVSMYHSSLEPQAHILLQLIVQITVLFKEKRISNKDTRRLQRNKKCHAQNPYVQKIWSIWNRLMVSRRHMAGSWGQGRQRLSVPESLPLMALNSFSASFWYLPHF